MVNPVMQKRTALLPRSRYRLVLSVFPGLKKAERLRAVEFRLPEIHPGSMEDILWTSRLLPGPSGTVLSALAPRREIEELRRTHPGSRIYIPIFHCIDLGYPRRGQKLELDYCGYLTDSLVRDTDDVYLLSSLPGGTVNRDTMETDDSRWRILSPRIPSIKKKAGGGTYRGAFAAEGSKGLSSGIRAALLCAAVLAGLGVYGERLLKAREAEYSALSSLTRNARERINASADLRAEIKALEARLKETEAEAHIDPWLFLNRFAPLMPPGARIRTLTTRGDSFTVELSGGEYRESALGLGDALSREQDFSDIIFQEVRFLQESPGTPGLPRYRLTGTFYSSFHSSTEKEDR